MEKVGMAKILIADDSETLRNELSEVLIGAGHEVIAAEDGKDGYIKAKENQDADLIITDYNMPGQDGVTMLQKIKSDIPAFENTPCAMLTTETSKELKMKGKSAGVIVWFVKPFAPDKLIKTVSLVLEKYKKAS